MPFVSANHIDAHRLADLRAWCYLLGPLSAAAVLRMRRYAALPAVRFHAYHSILVGAAWAAVLLSLWVAESVSPWFLGTLLREARFAFNVICAGIWGGLVIAAYRGWRFSVIPPLERKAWRWAGTPLAFGNRLR